MEKKMKVEIWSDMMCPFCYIGKRKFESALNSLPQKDSVEVVWHSFQLNPNLKAQPEQDSYSYLAELKGQSREWSVNMHDNLTKAAKIVGLEYNFGRAKISNSFDAHRLVQLAKKHKLTDELEERFFKAYFTDGELLSDRDSLIRLASEAGLPKDEIIGVLDSDQYAEEVRRDIQEARQLGVTGVPFFVLDRKFAVSGAQDVSVFTDSLQKAMDGWNKNNQAIQSEAIND